jgi:hypothetical protein
MAVQSLRNHCAIEGQLLLNRFKKKSLSQSSRWEDSSKPLYDSCAIAVQLLRDRSAKTTKLLLRYRRALAGMYLRNRGAMAALLQYNRCLGALL